MTDRPIAKAALLALIQAQPEGSTFYWWGGGGLSVMDPTGRYCGYIDLIWRQEFVAASTSFVPANLA